MSLWLLDPPVLLAFAAVAVAGVLLLVAGVAGIARFRRSNPVGEALPKRIPGRALCELQETPF
jgi:hypothetical protein